MAGVLSKHSTAVFATAALLLAASEDARAADAAVAPPAETPPPAAKAAPPAAPEDDTLELRERYVLETGKYEFTPAAKGSLKLAIHGETQLRYRAMTNLPLEAPVTDPGATTLGQKQYVYEWLRLGARFQYRDHLALVAEVDFPRGFAAGDSTRYVDAARDSFNDAKWYEFHPRKFYLEIEAPFGLFRFGQQTSHWGMGLLANDGEHAQFFGDLIRGSIVERALFATTPAGKGTPFTIVLAGDVVFEDPTAVLSQGDRAFQGIAALLWREKVAELGVYGVLRHQTRDRRPTDLTLYTDELTAGVIDVTGKFNAHVPGDPRGLVYGQMEGAAIFGSTNQLRGAYQTVEPGAEVPKEKLRSFGAAATLGVVHIAGEGRRRWGDAVFELETGYAGGDANPNDGVTKRFTFDPNHHVGLILFNQVMGWKTARAATIAADPGLVARAAPGLDLLPSNGGVFGAEYINPRIMIRPVSWLDLKTGAVIAQTSADFVDPYRFAALGEVANYDGGDAHEHDLGVEVDVGFEARHQLDQGTTLQFGAEGGTFVPGHAFDDKQGNRMATQYLANIKAGFQF